MLPNVIDPQPAHVWNGTGMLRELDGDVRRRLTEQGSPILGVFRAAMRIASRTWTSTTATPGAIVATEDPREAVRAAGLLTEFQRPMGNAAGVGAQAWRWGSAGERTARRHNRRSLAHRPAGSWKTTLRGTINST